MSLRKMTSLIVPTMLAFLCLVANTEAASSGSIVYLKNHNVWLSSPDGTNPHQVTTGGTFENPWRSPSQSDDGTIAASFGNEIVRMGQNGQVLNRMDPPALINSVGHPMDGVPVEVAISPDGKLIAYTYAGYECPVGASCGARVTTGYTAADRLTSPEKYGSTYFSHASWVGNTRTVQSGGFGSQINFHDLGQGDPVHWFDDSDYAENSTDLSDGELSPDGTRFAAIRGYDDSSQVIWYQVSGNAITGTPPVVPEPECLTGQLNGLAGPTWAPDSQAIAWEEPDGIWTKASPGTCESPKTSLVIPGGSVPDWGPAAVNPRPIRQLRVKLVSTTLGKALKRGIAAKVTGAAAGKVSSTLLRGGKVVGSGKATSDSLGSATVRAMFTAKARKALKKASKVKLTAKVSAGSDAAKIVFVIKR